MSPDASCSWPITPPYDFAGSTRPLRVGTHDPTLRHEADGLWRTAHTSDGPATVRLRVDDRAVHADAWGAGAAAVMRDVPRWVGLHESPWILPAHPVVDRLLREHRGLRSTDTRHVFQALVVVVLQQLVTWEEAAASWRQLCLRLGERGPGPGDLQLSPTPRAIRTAGTVHLQAAGVGPRQARTLQEIARVAHALAPAADMPTDEAAALLQKVRGIGPWTASVTLGLRLGRPEPIPLGDYNLPHTIAWALAGEPRGTDARMLELLAPFSGQAFRVIRLVRAAGIAAPRRGPRVAWRAHWRG
jgi:3-methyladenine DNA glycosylase/8-oxoguanine DNA glycosylase